MPPKKKNKKSIKKDHCPEEISEEERMEQLGIFEEDEEKDESLDESWRDVG